MNNLLIERVLFYSFVTIGGVSKNTVNSESSIVIMSKKI